MKSEREAIEEWGFEASVQIKGAMLERDWGYKELAEALKKLGVRRSPTAINRRINRGNFTAGFFLACLFALKNAKGEDSGASSMSDTKGATSMSGE
ncbi:conserved hypothetical protein [Ricinus communis]|uniref:DUF6471 domain-containing protein n=1 Tax=Ricinus communis TaxID=3988 RepID=B9T939_RICCO|nr:conserved hypothetical protein [Ricinus communis]